MKVFRKISDFFANFAFQMLNYDEKQELYI